MIEAAISGFEAQKVRIDDQIAELRSMLSGSPAAGAVTSVNGRKRRKFSPEAVQRMREAQQRRWAKARGESAPAKAAGVSKPKKKRRLSAEGRKRIIEALKKRWAAKKAAGTSGEQPAKKAARKKSGVPKVA